MRMSCKSVGFSKEIAIKKFLLQLELEYERPNLTNNFQRNKITFEDGHSSEMNFGLNFESLNFWRRKKKKKLLYKKVCNHFLICFQDTYF